MLFVGNVTVLESATEMNETLLNEIEQNMLASRRYLVNSFEMLNLKYFRFFISYTFALSYLIPLVAVWYFYFKIILKMCQRKRQMQTKRTATKKRTTKVCIQKYHKNSTSLPLKLLTLEKHCFFQVTIMGLAIVISYTHCWLPFWIVQWSIEANLFEK